MPGNGTTELPRPELTAAGQSHALTTSELVPLQPALAFEQSIELLGVEANSPPQLGARQAARLELLVDLKDFGVDVVMIRGCHDPGL